MTTRALALQLGCTELARATATARGCDCSRAGLPRDCARPAPPPCWLSNHGRASPTHPGRSRPPRLDGSQFASPPALIRIRAALPRGLQTRRWWCRGCRQCMPRGTPLARGRAGQCLSRDISQYLPTWAAWARHSSHLQFAAHPYTHPGPNPQAPTTRSPRRVSSRSPSR